MVHDSFSHDIDDTTSTDSVTRWDLCLRHNFQELKLLSSVSSVRSIGDSTCHMCNTHLKANTPRRNISPLAPRPPLSTPCTIFHLHFSMFHVSCPRLCFCFSFGLALVLAPCPLPLVPCFASCPCLFAFCLLPLPLSSLFVIVSCRFIPHGSYR